MNRIEFKRSLIKTVGLVLGGVLLVLASFFATRADDRPFLRAVAWVGVVFFSVGTVKALVDLFSPGVIYVFDDQGIEDRRSGVGMIPWTAITNVDFVSIRGTEFICLTLDRPDDYFARLSPMKRRFAQLNGRSLGVGDWALSFVGASPGVAEAQDFVDRKMRREPAAGLAYKA